mmetsp:Transcript_23638/g.59191  ORF Transcript_23638/g.59191 Transcript_23638/m.59191 type:complete len:95 (+) Transcript_23638:531-815(+)
MTIGQLLELLRRLDVEFPADLAPVRAVVLLNRYITSATEVALGLQELLLQTLNFLNEMEAVFHEQSLVNVSQTGLVRLGIFRWKKNPLYVVYIQ